MRSIRREDLPNSSFPWIEIMEKGFNHLYTDYNLLLKLGRAGETGRSSQKSLRFRPPGSFTYRSLASDADAEGKTGEARDQIRQAITRCPNRIEDLLALGQSAAALSLPEEAETCYRKGIAVSASPEAHLLLAVLISEQERDQEAMPLLDRAAELAPQWFEPYLHMAIIHDKAGDSEKTRQCLARAHALEPGNVQVAIALASQTMTADAGAVSVLKRSLRLNPESYALLAALGWAYNRSENYEAAYRALCRAARIDPANFQLQENIGLAASRTRRYAKAVQAFFASELLAPPDERALDGADYPAATPAFVAAATALAREATKRPDDPQSHSLLYAIFTRIYSETAAREADRHLTAVFAGVKKDGVNALLKWGEQQLEAEMDRRARRCK